MTVRDVGGQVTTTVLKSGKKLLSDMVVAGVGAKPTGDIFKGQLDFLEERPGGIKVPTLAPVPCRPLQCGPGGPTTLPPNRLHAATEGSPVRRRMGSYRAAIQMCSWSATLLPSRCRGTAARCSGKSTCRFYAEP